ncbi:hypothetical protein [Curtobacterium sp. UCD-KPL2560]|uniref:hypothetical protein n=1 Tax=Curtobacterium sp. UCD-KPL2560 TaxID=1885315 RepID=UPI0008245C89|nr:hypothetical protein [Curtobacterium sp. UCD-KPL2560]
MHERVLSVPLIRTSGFPPAERRSLQRQVRRGTLVAVRPGALVDPADVAGLRPEEQHLLLVRATAPRIVPPLVLSDRSAAAAHGLPFVGPTPDRVEVRDPRRSRTETTARLRVRPVRQRTSTGTDRWSGTPPFRPADFAGVVVEPLVDVLVEVASTEPLLSALPMIDAALHDRRILPEMLVDELRSADWKGHAKVAAAVEMGSAASGSPAESVCRVRFRQLGLAQPVQQHRFVRPGHRDAVVDFWFPDHGVVVEVDGRAKYEDDAMLAGRSTAEAHWQEKQREDFVRSFAAVRRVVRVTWADLMDPERLRAALVRAGLPCR